MFGQPLLFETIHFLEGGGAISFRQQSFDQAHLRGIVERVLAEQLARLLLDRLPFTEREAHYQ